MIFASRVGSFFSSVKLILNASEAHFSWALNVGGKTHKRMWLVFLMTQKIEQMKFHLFLKSVSFKTNSVKIGSTAAGHVGQNSSAHVARSSRSNLEAARLKWNGLECYLTKRSWVDWINWNCIFQNLIACSSDWDKAAISAWYFWINIENILFAHFHWMVKNLEWEVEFEYLYILPAMKVYILIFEPWLEHLQFVC